MRLRMQSCLSHWRVAVPDWRSIARQHGGPFLLLALALFIGQAVSMGQHEVITRTSDTPSYLLIAHQILHGGGIFATIRTPGYPLFLALIFLVRGEEDLQAVVAVQMVLTIVAITQIYGIALRLFRLPWIAAGMASLLALNLYLLNWEHAIITESLALFLVITLYACFTRYLYCDHPAQIIWMTLLAGTLVLVRPLFLFLPALIFATLLARAWVRRVPRAVWRPLTGGLVATYAIVGIALIGNGMTSGFFGLSTVSNVNLFGKILEYHMEDETDDPAFTQLRADLHVYLHTMGSTEPWGFPYHYPYYSQHAYAPLTQFSDTIILHHPLEFLVKSGNDLLMTLDAYPVNYSPYDAPMSERVRALLNLSYAPLAFYDLFPIAFVAWLILWWRRRADAASTVLVMLGLGVTGSILMAALGSYLVEAHGQVSGELYRLRAVMDWAAILVSFAALLEVGGALAQAKRMRATPARIVTKSLETLPSATMILPRHLFQEHELHGTANHHPAVLESPQEDSCMWHATSHPEDIGAATILVGPLNDGKGGDDRSYHLSANEQTPLLEDTVPRSAVSALLIHALPLSPLDY